MGKFVQRAQLVLGDGCGPEASEADAFSVKYPALYEYLRVSVWEDGALRETSTLLVLWEEGAWKGCLHDRAQSRVLWVTGRSLMDLLQRLDAGLASGEADWRRKVPWKGRKS